MTCATIANATCLRVDGSHPPRQSLTGITLKTNGASVLLVFGKTLLDAFVVSLGVLRRKAGRIGREQGITCRIRQATLTGVFLRPKSLVHVLDQRADGIVLQDGLESLVNHREAVSLFDVDVDVARVVHVHTIHHLAHISAVGGLAGFVLPPTDGGIHTDSKFAMLGGDLHVLSQRQLQGVLLVG